MPTGYSYIYNPYMCLIYEALEAITTSLMTTSAVAYSAELSSTTTLATIQGMIGGTYYGIGKLFLFFIFVTNVIILKILFPLRSRRWQLCWRLPDEIVRH